MRKEAHPEASTESEVQKESNSLDMALTAFMDTFIEPGSNSVAQVLRSVSSKAESLLSSQINSRKKTTSPSGQSSATVNVIHKLDSTTENVAHLKRENLALHTENRELKQKLEQLTAELAEAKQSLARQHSDSCDDSMETSDSITATPESLNADRATIPERNEVQVSNTSGSLSNSHGLSPMDITTFNKLPRDLHEFYQQMQTGNFSREAYSKCSSTKSVCTKRRLVYKFIEDYDGGVDKIMMDYQGKTPNWIYNNVVKKARV